MQNAVYSAQVRSAVEFHFEHSQYPAGGDVMAANIPKEWIYAKTRPASAPTLS